MLILLGILVLCASVGIDYAHTRYVQLVQQRKCWGAAFWSILQWCSATVGFVLVVKVSLWLLPFEACGLFIGTLVAVRRDRPQATVAASNNYAKKVIGFGG